MSEHVESPAAFAPAQWLRWLGAISFIGAGASFLVEGWTDPGLVKRQALWAAGTLIMTLLGIVAVRAFRDSRGARVFLGLAAATIPAHFAQLGSGVYDWNGGSNGELRAILVAGAIVLLLLPPLALGMSALIRRRGRTLTLLMFLFSSPLVIPSRDPAAIAFIAGAHVALWLFLEAMLFSRDTLFDSVEGIAARSMLLSPALIVLARNGFHDTGAVWIAASVGWPSLALLLWPKLRQITNLATLVMQTVGVLGCFVALIALDPPALLLALALSIVALAGAELVHSRPAMLAWVGVCLLGSSAALAYAEHGWATSIALIPLGTLHALAAFRRRSAWLFAMAVAATLGGAVAHLSRLVTFPKHDLWLAGAALAVVLLALASLLESRKTQLERMATRLQRHFARGQ